jgi:hypothetical protein
LTAMIGSKTGPTFGSHQHRLTNQAIPPSKQVSDVSICVTLRGSASGTVTAGHHPRLRWCASVTGGRAVHPSLSCVREALGPYLGVVYRMLYHYRSPTNSSTWQTPPPASYSPVLLPVVWQTWPKYLTSCRGNAGEQR